MASEILNGLALTRRCQCKIWVEFRRLGIESIDSLLIIYIDLSLRKLAILKLPSVFFNVTSQQFDFSEASEVAQWVSVLATRSDDLSLIVTSRIHMVEGENQGLYMCVSTCMFPLYSPLSQMKK